MKTSQTAHQHPKLCVKREQKSIKEEKETFPSLWENRACVLRVEIVMAMNRKARAQSVRTPKRPYTKTPVRRNGPTPTRADAVAMERPH